MKRAKRIVACEISRSIENPDKECRSERIIGGLCAEDSIC